MGGKGFQKRHLFLHVLAGMVARTCRDGCTYLQGRLHVLEEKMQF